MTKTGAASSYGISPTPAGSNINSYMVPIPENVRKICRAVIFKHCADDALATASVSIETKLPFVEREVKEVIWRSKK